MEDEQNIEKLQIEYYDVEAGWMNIRLKAGDKMYEERMSHVFDPLPDLKLWLEAIVLGVEQTSFTFNNEGSMIKFNAKRRWVNRKINYLLTIIWEDGNKIEFQVLVDKKQMIDAFYTTLVNFFNSDKYVPRKWERQTIYDKIEKYFKINHEQILDYCAKLSKQELIDLFKTIEADVADWWIENDYPQDYDTQSFEDKRENMKYLLEKNANPYDGTSLSDFCSEIIEKYLNEK